MAREFRRFNVSSSGGVSFGVSFIMSFLERGCLTILAIGREVSCVLTGAFAVTTFGFIREVLKLIILVYNTSSYASKSSKGTDQSGRRKQQNEGTKES